MQAAPHLEFVMEARVTVGAVLDIGRAPAGERRIIPITGGAFDGPGLRGRVLPGGAFHASFLAGTVTTTQTVVPHSPSKSAGALHP